MKNYFYMQWFKININHLIYVPTYYSQYYLKFKLMIDVLVYSSEL